MALLRGCKESGVKSGMCGEAECEHSILLLADVCWALPFYWGGTIQLL